MNALPIALARHDAPLDRNGELVAHCTHLICAQARPGREGERAIQVSKMLASRSLDTMRPWTGTVNSLPIALT